MILVSGGSGLVGSYLLRELTKKEEKIRAIYRSNDSLNKTKKLFEAFKEEENFEKIEWTKADLLNVPDLEECFQGIKKVYHSAAIVSFHKSDAEKMMAVNIEGTANMVNLSLDHGIEKFCHVSSVAALGRYRDGACSDENTLWQKEENTSDYSISKFYSENEVWRASEEGLKTVIINPSTIIGFGDWNQSSSSIFKKVAEGLPFYTPGRTGFVAVEDVVASMIQLMESNISEERFVISAENITYRKLFSMIAKSMDKKAPSISLQKWQAKFYVRLLSFLSFFMRKTAGLSMANVHSAFNDRCFDSTKIKDRLGFRFEGIEQSIEKCGKLYKQNY